MSASIFDCLHPAFDDDGVCTCCREHYSDEADKGHAEFLRQWLRQNGDNPKHAVHAKVARDWLVRHGHQPNPTQVPK